MNKQVIVNREEVRNNLEKDSAFFIFSGNNIKSSADAHYPFIVNRNFYHLTQINEPNLMLVITDTTEMLFIEESDELFEKWVGKKISKEEAYNKSKIKNIYYLSEFEEDILKRHKNIYLDLEKDQFNDYPTPAVKFKEEYNLNVIDGYNIISKSRAIKSEAEVNEIKKAINITQVGLVSIMKNLQVGKKESFFEAHFDFILKCENVTTAFPTIAASGKNATVLHYGENNAVVNDGDLILFDLGATHNLYCADISRTYPVNGKFTARQKELYEMVLKANEMVINAIKPGVTMGELNDIVIKFYEKELVRLNVIENKEEVKDYYFHGVSHSLGLDTHDVGLDRSSKLEAGNIITVEPGIYIPEENIGIRIEDDVLVTKTGSENLSKNIIKTVKDIEEFMRNAK